MKRVIALLLAMVLLISLTACDKKNPPAGTDSPGTQEGTEPAKENQQPGGEPAQNSETEQENQEPAEPDLAEDGGTLTASGVSVDFTPGLNVPSDVPLTVVAKAPVTDEEMGATYTAYDISLGDAHDLGGYVTIRLPYDGSRIEPGQDPAQCVAGRYYNEETEEWESVLYDVDTAKKELIIRTDHFSTYGCFEFINEGKRAARVTKIDQYAASVDLGDISAALEEVLGNGGKPDLACRELMRPYLEDSFNALAELVGKTDDKATEIGNLTTMIIQGGGLGDIVGNSEWANGLTTALSYAGIATAITNLGVSAMKSDKSRNDIMGMYKSAVYLLGSLSQSATLGTVGASVWVIDKALTDMGNYAYSKIAEDTKKAYRHYYSKYKTRTRGEWRWALKDAIRAAAKNQQKADTAVMEELDRWCNLFWEIDSDTYTNVLIDVGQNGRGLPDADTKKAITEEYKGDLIRILEPVLEEVQMDLELELEAEQQRRIEDFRKKLNSVFTFYIEEKMNKDQKEARFKGYTVCFGPLSDAADKEDWRFPMSEKGSLRVQSTFVAWMLAGSPKEIWLYEPGKDPDTEEKPDLVVPFKMTAPNINITLNQAPALKDLLGSWEGEIEVTAVNISDEAFASFKETMGDGTIDIENFGEAEVGEEVTELKQADCDEALSELVAEGGLGLLNSFTLSSDNPDSGECTFGFTMFSNDDDEYEEIPCNVDAVYKDGVFTLKGLASGTLMASEEEGEYRIDGRGVKLPMAEEEMAILFMTANVDAHMSK
ncbi:MAG: hypothetical protein J6P31_07465 [Oscillospiraceae bacterium]|nr:hypothetical protein [Oscillospiraceae bacterium]